MLHNALHCDFDKSTTLLGKRVEDISAVRNYAKRSMAAAEGDETGSLSLLSGGSTVGCHLVEMLLPRDICRLSECSAKTLSAVELWCSLRLPAAVEAQEAQLQVIADHPNGIPLDNFSTFRGYLRALGRLPLGHEALPSNSWRQRLEQARAPRHRREGTIPLQPAADPVQVFVAPPAEEPLPTLPMMDAVHMVRSPAQQRGGGKRSSTGAAAVALRSSLDWGYPNEPPHKGWLNAFGLRGFPPNDYIRRVGDDPNIWYAVTVAGSDAHTSQYLEWDVDAFPVNAEGMQPEARSGIQRNMNLPWCFVYQRWQAAAAAVQDLETQE